MDILFIDIQKKLSERDITITLSDNAKAYIAEAGFDPVYGARPLKRVIQRELQNALAERILAGEIADGTTVEVHAGPEGLTFERSEAVEAA